MRERERGGALSKRGRSAQRILLIQPDAVLGLALHRFLAEHFAVVAVATSVPTALSMLEGHPHYDAVVVDDEASERLAGVVSDIFAIDPTLAQRVVLLSGEPDAFHLHGVRHVVLKPAPGEALLAAVDDCLGPGLHKVAPRKRVRIPRELPKSR